MRRNWWAVWRSSSHCSSPLSRSILQAGKTSLDGRNLFTPHPSSDRKHDIDQRKHTKFAAVNDSEMIVAWRPDAYSAFRRGDICALSPEDALPSATNRMVGTRPIILSAKTLGFRTILIALPVENPESLTTFFIEEKSAVSKCLSRKDLASRGGFEPPTFRLTASDVI